jgi:acyl carrier protein
MPTQHAEEVRTFISNSFFVDDFRDEDSFLQNGIIDSTGMLELVAFLEETYELKIEDTELIPENLDSVSNVCRFIERKRTQAA